MNCSVYNPTIPYCAPLPGPLQPGQIIRIQGTPNTSATCFSINLQNGSSIDRRNDVALHLSPVFSPPPRLVRNSITNQQWGPEESHGSHFPFSPGQGFDIMILVESDCFKIAVNGQHFTEFRHRLPVANISHLAIDGDVTINTVKYESSSGQTSPHSETGKGSGVTMPIGFITPDVHPEGPPSLGYGRPPSPYGVPTYSMPSSAPGQNPYGPPPMSAPYLQPSSIPPPPPGYPSPVQSPTYPGPPSAYPNQGAPPAYPSYNYPSQNYPSQPGAYPSQPGAYPSQPGAYPSHGYPSANPYHTQPGPYSGTSVVYPGTEKEKSGASSLMGPLAGPLAAGAAALAGSALMSGKHGKHGKHLGPGSFITDGAAALLGGGTHGQHRSSKSSAIPIGGAVAGGAAALAGAYMLSKSPLGKVMKPKKMKKLYKHKHKVKGYWNHSSSSSSSSDE